MKKLTILLGCLCFIPRMIGFSDATESGFAWERTVDGAVQLNPDQEIFKEFPFCGKPEGKGEKEFNEDVYKFIFGNDLIKGKSFVSGIDVTARNPEFTNQIGNFHSQVVYEHLCENEADDENVKAIYRDKVKSYLKMLTNVHLNRLRIDNVNKPEGEKLWMFKDEKRHARNIENMVELATDIIVNNGQGYQYRNPDFIKSAGRTGYACQVVLRHMFENIRSEYEECAAEIKGKSNRVIGERDVAKASAQNPSKSDGDSFLDLFSLNRWLLLADNNFDEGFKVLRRSTLSDFYYKNCVSNGYEKPDNPGFELLRSCVVGLYEQLTQKLRETKTKTPSLEDTDEIKITDMNGRELVVTVKQARKIRSRYLEFSANKRALSRATNAYNTFEKIKNVMDKNSKNKKMLEGSIDNNLLPDENHSVINDNNDKISQLTTDILKNIDEELLQIIEEVISSAVEHFTNADEEDNPSEVDNALTLFQNVVNGLKELPSVVNSENKLKEEIIEIGKDKDEERNEKFNEAIKKITESDQNVLIQLMIDTTKKSSESYKNKILGFVKSIVSDDDPNESLFGANKELYEEIKKPYINLVFAVETYMTDLGFIDINSKYSPAVNKYAKVVPTAKYLAGVKNDNGCSSSDWHNGKIDEKIGNESLEQALTTADYSLQHNAAVRYLKNQKATVEGQNEAMIPGVFRKAGIMFCNLKDHLSWEKDLATSGDLRNAITFSQDVFSSQYEKDRDAVNSNLTIEGKNIDQMLQECQIRLKTADVENNPAFKKFCEDMRDKLLGLKARHSDVRNSNSVKDRTVFFINQKSIYQSNKIRELGRLYKDLIQAITGNEEAAEVIAANVLLKPEDKKILEGFARLLSAVEGGKNLLPAGKQKLTEDQENKLIEYTKSAKSLVQEKAKILGELEKLRKENEELLRAKKELPALTDKLSHLNNKLVEQQNELKTLQDQNNKNNEQKIKDLQKKIKEQEETIEKQKSEIIHLQEVQSNEKRITEEDPNKIDKSTRDVNEKEEEVIKTQKELQEDLKATVPPPPPFLIPPAQTVIKKDLNKNANTGVPKKTQPAKPHLSLAEELALARQRLTKKSDEKLEYIDDRGRQIAISKDNAQEQATNIYNRISELETRKEPDKNKVTRLKFLLSFKNNAQNLGTQINEYIKTADNEEKAMLSDLLTVKDNAQTLETKINDYILKLDKARATINGLKALLSKIEKLFQTKPKIDNRNFLQKALSKAIANRRANLHMHDDEDEDDEDDWD